MTIEHCDTPKMKLALSSVVSFRKYAELSSIPLYTPSHLKTSSKEIVSADSIHGFSLYWLIAT